MNKSKTLILLCIVSVLTVWVTCELRINAYSAPVGGEIGPDVIVGDLPGVTRWGTSDGKTAFSVATTSCNIGDERLLWIANSQNHPVISQNLFRVSNGRIEQLGQSWLKHGFFAIQGGLCSSCCGGCQAENGNVALGVGCSDPYSSGLNGQQGGLGPRSEVNAATGVFPWPYRSLQNNAEERGTLGGRIQVDNDDLDPSQNPGAQYFIESQYVTQDDAAAGNDNNNASYRRVLVTGTTSFNLQVSGPTVRTEPAIYAWRAVHPDVELFNVDIPDDGRVVVGVRVTETENGYHTEVAIENQTSHRCVRSLGVDFVGGTVFNPGFNDVDYHAEDYSGADWLPTEDSSSMEWATETFEQNQNANALRWGTLYSFWCDSDAHPSELTLGLFRPGKLSEVNIELEVPLVLGDLDGDGAASLADIPLFVDLLSNGGYQAEADIDMDGSVTLADIPGFVAILSGG